MSQVSIAASRFLSSPLNAFAAPLRGPSASSGLTGVSNGTAAASTYPADPTADGGGSDTMTAAGSTAAGVVPVGAAAAGMGYSQDLSGLTPDGPDEPGAVAAIGARGGSPRSDAGFSDAASRYDGTPSFAGQAPHGGGSGIPRRPSGLAVDPTSPTSAAGSRFDTSSPGSAMTFASRVGFGSPTGKGGRGGRGAAGGGGVGAAPLTARSVASSMRSDGDSSFFKTSAAGSSQRSSDSRGGGAGFGSASGSSWDEEDLQNMGTRWLADRAYNQQFDEQK